MRESNKKVKKENAMKLKTIVKTFATTLLAVSLTAWEDSGLRYRRICRNALRE